MVVTKECSGSKLLWEASRTDYNTTPNARPKQSKNTKNTKHWKIHTRIASCSLKQGACSKPSLGLQRRPMRDKRENARAVENMVLSCMNFLNSAYLQSGSGQDHFAWSAVNLWFLSYQPGLGYVLRTLT